MKAQSTGTILLVDDDRDVLDAVRRALYRREYRILKTTDPLEAAKMLEAEEVDVIISDIDMPHMNGHQLMRVARTVRPRAVRMLLTGRATMESAVTGINEGEIYRFIVKPFDPTDLRAQVAEALARKAELDLASEAQLRAQRRKVLYEHLESEHPGISKFDRDAAGAYLHDLARARRKAAEVGLAGLFPERS